MGGGDGVLIRLSGAVQPRNPMRRNFSDAFDLFPAGRKLELARSLRFDSPGFSMIKDNTFRCN
jgi:hypothetical protein